jgi:hypothetical protein
LKHFPSSQERQTLATRSAKEAPHKMHFVVVILRHLQPSLFFIVFVQGEPPFAPATWQTRWSASTTWQTQGSASTIRHSLFAAVFQSPVANHQSLPFLPFATRHSPLAAVLASRCRSRHSPLATRHSPPLRFLPLS